MDLPEISLWMFLVISFDIGGCRTFPKYIVGNNRMSNAVSDNCFCFKYSGDHQKVPEILSNKKDNLERVVVFLYKDKSTEEIKMYIPNHEKQALVPDLAFEVGDKLHTIEDDKKIKDIFTYSRTSVDNIPVDHKQPDISASNEAFYIDDMQQEKTDLYSYELPSKEVDEPINIDDQDQHVKPNIINSYEVPLQINIPPVVNVDDDDEHHVPHSLLDVDSNESPSNEVNEQPAIHVDGGINKGEHIKPNVNSHEMPSEVNTTPVSVNVNDDDDDWKHDKPEVNFDKLSSGEVSEPININTNDYNTNTNSYQESSNEVHVPAIPKDKVNGEDSGQHVKPDIDYYEISKEISAPPINTNVDDFNNHKQDFKPISDVYEVNVPEIYDNVDNYDRQHNKSVVDFDKAQLNEVSISSVTVNGDNKDHHEQHMSITSQEVNRPPIAINDDGDYHEQDQQLDSHPHFPSEVDSHYNPSKPIQIKEIESSESSGNRDQTSSEESFPIGDDRRSESGEKFDISYEINDNVEHSKINESKFPHHKLNRNKYETFDRWFIQQMQRFKTYTEHDKAVSLLTIERYILNILHNNHMHVTAEGVLTDAFGTALDVQNLNLRPILIGNTMAFKNILEDEIRDLVIPENMAYLQAILVTNSHPSMILGIIPIGKTVIPPSTSNAFSVLKPNRYSSWLSQGQKQNHRSIYKTGSAKNNLETSDNKKYYIDKKKPIAVHLSIANHKPVNVGRNKGRTIISVAEKNPISVNSRINGEKINGVNVNLTNDSVEVFNKLLVSLQNGEDPIKSAEETNKLIAALQNGDELTSTPEELGGKDGAQDSDEDYLTGRIIGGSAATSSGTPLSIKGRIKDF